MIPLTVFGIPSNVVGMDHEVYIFFFNIDRTLGNIPLVILLLSTKLLPPSWTPKRVNHPCQHTLDRWPEGGMPRVYYNWVHRHLRHSVQSFMAIEEFTLMHYYNLSVSLL